MAHRTYAEEPWAGVVRWWARRPEHRAEEKKTDPTAALRAATSVLGCDAVLSATPRPDWAALAEEHRGRPFERPQRRALVKRPDCPEPLLRALLTPWDPAVANRLVTRDVPPWARRKALSRIGEIRPSLIRHVLTEDTAEELILTTRRLDLLVRAVDGYDHNHHAKVKAFWECAGRLLRRELHDDPAAWLSAATVLPRHQGPFHTRPHATDIGPDLRVLATAPDRVLAGAIGELTDETLSALHDRDIRPRRAREALTAMVLDRFVAAGVPPRPIFARWAYGAHATVRTRAWAHGLYPQLDRLNESRAAYDVTLRRLLAARVERRPDDLSACANPIEAEALLIAAYGPAGSPPWQSLDATALTGPVLCALAAREGFPETLARRLPERDRVLLSGHSPAAARLAVTALDRTASPQAVLSGAVRVLDPDELVRTSRPARHLLMYAASTPHGPLAAHCVRLAEAAPPDWPEVARLIPAFDGTVLDLLEAAGKRVRALPT